MPNDPLVAGLQVLVQERRLKVVPGMPEADQLARELTVFRASVSFDPNDAATDWRSRPNDDLVLAVAMAA